MFRNPRTRRSSHAFAVAVISSLALSGCGGSGPDLPVEFRNSSWPGLSIAPQAGGEASVSSAALDESRECFVPVKSEADDVISGSATWNIDSGWLSVDGKDWHIAGYFGSAPYGTDWSELRLQACDGGTFSMFDSE